MEDTFQNLIERISTAPSLTFVKHIVEAEMMIDAESRHGVTEKIQLAEKIVRTINSLNPVNYGPEEWSNIIMARIHFNYLKLKMKTETT